MVAREIVIDNTTYLIKQGKLGSFEVLIFAENGYTIGSLSIELTAKLSGVLHQSSQIGASGRRIWEFNDLLSKLSLQKFTSSSGCYFQAIWAKKSNQRQKFTLIIPEGTRFQGWKRFAIALDSLNPNSRNFGESAFPCADLAGISRVHINDRGTTKSIVIDALGHQENFGAWKNGVICTRASTRISWEQIGSFLAKSYDLVTRSNFCL